MDARRATLVLTGADSDKWVRTPRIFKERVAGHYAAQPQSLNAGSAIRCTTCEGT
jgi:hypothetical protein